MRPGPKRALLRAVPVLFSDRLGALLLRRWARRLRDEIDGELTDAFLELLLDAMDLAFVLVNDYRRNLRGFRGAYAFTTADARVATSAVFADETMTVHHDTGKAWNVLVTFKDAAALRRFLLSKDQDVLESLLANEVEVDGNLNYLYKLGFLARDLVRRLQID